MKDFFMGAEVEVQELRLGEAPPDVTPPQGVIIQGVEGDGWTRKYLYKAHRDLSGKRVHSKILYGEVPPKVHVPVPTDHAIRFTQAPRAGRQGVPQPILDSRLLIPAQMGVRVFHHVPVLGQTSLAPDQSQQPSAAPPLVPSQAPIPTAGSQPTDVPLPLTQQPTLPSPLPGAPPSPVNPPAPGGPVQGGLPALPAVCMSPMQLPDGTILNPTDVITFKDLCALLPYIMKSEKVESRRQRPGAVPLSNAPWAGIPSFGPAGSPFGQGGGGGGGGGQAGPGPIGVVTGPTPQGGMSGGPGPVGPTGPAGPAGAPGALPDGAVTTVPFGNAGPYLVVPGTQFTINVGGNGNTVFLITAPLLHSGRASIWDVFVGIQIDGTNYTLWENSEEQGAGSDQAFILTASGIAFFPGLALGSHSIAMIYGNNPVENPFVLNASVNIPASIVAIHP